MLHVRAFFLRGPGLPLLCFLTWLLRTLWGGAEAAGEEIAPPPSTLAKERERHTLPAKPYVGGKVPTFADPKASSTAESGKGAPRRGSTTCGLFPREAKRRERERETDERKKERERERVQCSGDCFIR